MSNKIPTQITDFNGRNTTVHKNPEKAVPVGRVPNLPPVPASKTPTEPNIVYPSIAGLLEHDYFSTVEMEVAFTKMADSLVAYLHENDEDGEVDHMKIAFPDGFDVSTIRSDMEKASELLGGLGEYDPSVYATEKPNSLAGIAYSLADSWRDMNAENIVRGNYLGAFAESFGIEPKNDDDDYEDIFLGNPNYELDGVYWYKV